MKNYRLSPLACASLFSALALGAVSLPDAGAQPGGADKMEKMGRVKAARGGLPKRMMVRLEEKLGKPLSADQKERLGVAYKARAAAQKIAQAKFAEEVAKITGLTAEQVAQLNKRGPRAGGKMDKMAPAPR